jgi:hypothetical protein
MRKVILVEFNELCPHLLKRWMDEGLLPNFRALHSASEVFVTQADETEPVNLEPWIQWYSVHSGLPYREHGIFHLTDGPRAAHKDIWRMLLEHGHSVWNCSSMNARGLDDPRALFLPDPWCTSEAANPAELGVFHRFVAQKVQEYSNPAKAMGVQDYVRFVAFMLRHGLQAKTVAMIARQLLSERTSGGRTTWKRAAILDRLQADLFLHYFRKAKPDFSTFFCNSTAHLQHSYWRCMAPESFTVKPSAAEVERFGGAILYGYQAMDRLLGDFTTLASAYDATLMFATALSQQPYLKYEHVGGHHFYRPRNVEALLAVLGVRASNLFPVMTHQFLAQFPDAAARDLAQEQLSELAYDGLCVFEFQTKPQEPNALYFGNQIHSLAPQEAVLETAGALPASTRYYDLFYKIDEIKSGRHHPDGCFWIGTGTHRMHQEKVSILDILPTVLGRFGLAAGQLTGRDLLEPEISEEIRLTA